MYNHVTVDPKAMASLAAHGRERERGTDKRPLDISLDRASSTVDQLTSRVEILRERLGVVLTPESPVSHRVGEDAKQESSPHSPFVHQMNAMSCRVAANVLELERILDRLDL